MRTETPGNSDIKSDTRHLVMRSSGLMEVGPG